MEIVAAVSDGRSVIPAERRERMLIRSHFQIFPWLNGWTYKNTASNGGLFQLGARLAVYTRNDTYALYAEKVFDWMSAHPLLQDDGTVNDGTSMDTKPMCKDADHTQWTYNYGIMIAGASYVRLHVCE
jgi:predicted alpha-1,6-mannanase (GH76 family)